MTEKRIAMWSGPRNISTALMRSWGNRSDTHVCDEPFYAHYLLATSHTDHPGYSETVCKHETHWPAVIDQLLGPIPGGKNIYYQKQMAHHLLPGMDVDWIDSLTNCFLIREPREVLLSLVEFLPAPTAEDTGLPQQTRLFNQVVERTGVEPPVIVARDLLENPPAMLKALCEQVDVPFTEEMLNWPRGPRSTDGAWAPYWYGKVYETTGFEHFRESTGTLASQILPVLDEIQPLYDRLYERRLRLANRAAACG